MKFSRRTKCNVHPISGVEISCRHSTVDNSNLQCSTVQSLILLECWSFNDSIERFHNRHFSFRKTPLSVWANKCRMIRKTLIVRIGKWVEMHTRICISNAMNAHTTLQFLILLSVHFQFFSFSFDCRRCFCCSLGFLLFPLMMTFFH